MTTSVARANAWFVPVLLVIITTDSGNSTQLGGQPEDCLLHVSNDVLYITILAVMDGDEDCGSRDTACHGPGCPSGRPRSSFLSLQHLLARQLPTLVLQEGLQQRHRYRSRQPRRQRLSRAGATTVQAALRGGHAASYLVPPRRRTPRCSQF